MEVKKRYIIMLLTFIFVVFGATVSYGSYSATDKTVTSGEQVSITITSTEALDAYNLDLKDCGELKFNNCSKTDAGAIININNSSIGYMNTSGNTTNLGTYNFTAPTVSKDTEYNVSFLVDKSTLVTAKVTVKAKETASSGNSGNSDTTTTPTTSTKSTEAKLSNFGIKPNEYDFSGFSKNTNKEDWSVEVPNNATEVEVYATPKDKNATVTGTGKVSLKEGNNTVKVTVTAEAGNTKTYTLTIKRRTAAEDATLTAETTSNADLKSLGIKPEEYDFSGFQKDITEYVAEVPSDVDEIEVYAEASNSKAQVNGIGKISLKEGKNEIKVEVIAEDGTTKTYTIEVTRGESNTTTTSKFGLSKLTISGLTLNPNFKVGTYEYTVELNEDLTSLDIEAIATDEKANVEIAGNENLQEGENIITILVSNKDTNETATYQITVNKNLSSQPETMSWLKPSTWGKEEIIKLIIIAVLVLLIISAIILKIKISKEGKQEKDVDLPGADELDKAMAEHQELSEYSGNLGDESNLDEENEIIIEDSKVDTNSNYLEEIAKNNGIEFTEDNNKSKRKGKHF